jgi:EmrB/QacA subfamily drug resistance transporter
VPGFASLDPATIYRRRWWTLSILCGSLVLIVMGNSVLNVALPTLVRELNASGSDLQWIVDAYALVFGGLLLTMGAVGDRFGRRGALQAGLGIVGLSSIGALFIDQATPLIVVRAIMGIGAALVMPATLSILSQVFPPEERGKAFGIWAAFAGLGGAIGPIVGGWLLENFNWASIFVLNIPVIVFGLVGAVFLVPPSRDENKTPLDPVGALLSILALGSILYGIIEGPDKGWSSPEVLAAFGLSALSWPAFVLWELRTPNPMLPMKYFKDRRFSSGNIALALTFYTMFAFFFVVTQYMQFVRGYGPLEAGLRMFPLAIGLMVSAPNSDKFARRFGVPATAAGGLLLVAVALGMLSTLDTDTAYPLMAAAFFLTGVGMGTAMAPSTTLIMDAVPRAKAGVGSAMNDTSREVGGALGIAALGSILNSVYAGSIQVPAGMPAAAAEAAKDSIGSAFYVAAKMPGAAGEQLMEAARLAFVDGLFAALVSGTVLTVLTAAFVWFAMPQRTTSMSPASPVPVGPVASTPVSVPQARAAPAAPRLVAPVMAARPSPPLDSVTQRLRDLDERLRALEAKRARNSDD